MNVPFCSLRRYIHFFPFHLLSKRRQPYDKSRHTLCLRSCICAPMNTAVMPLRSRGLMLRAPCWRTCCPVRTLRGEWGSWRCTGQPARSSRRWVVGTVGAGACCFSSTIYQCRAAVVHVLGYGFWRTCKASVLHLAPHLRPKSGCVWSSMIAQNAFFSGDLLHSAQLIYLQYVSCTAQAFNIASSEEHRAQTR